MDGLGDLVLGVHVSRVSHVLTDDKKTYALHDAILRDVSALGLNAAQIFTHGPRALQMTNYNVADVRDASDEIAALVVHSAYMLIQVWRSKWPLHKIREQLEVCADIGACGLVLHLNKQPPVNVVKVMQMLRPLAEKTGVLVLLEMTAMHASSHSYETPLKLNYITRSIGASWWSWCIDTAHIWAAGVNIRTYTAMRNWLSEIIPGSIQLFHLNGSSAELGSGRDIHQIIFTPDDCIWHGVDPKQSGVRAIVEYALAANVPIICEINRGTGAQQALNVIKTMAAQHAE